jgi:hypothetical protein
MTYERCESVAAVNSKPGDRIDSDPAVQRIERNEDEITIYFPGAVTADHDVDFWHDE